MDFDTAFDRLLGNEGALSLDPNDRGNWTSGIIGVGELKGTKWGVSAAAYPHLDIRNLTKSDAKAVYLADFWSRIHADDLPPAAAFQAFDFAVNSGIGTAIRYYQRALGVADDGAWGPVTRSAAIAMAASDQVMRLCAERLDFMTRLSGWPTQGRGWARRIANNLRYGAVDS